MRILVVILLMLGACKKTEPPSPFEGLGSHSRKIASAKAQSAFDEGLAFFYAFNHDQAIRSFERAKRLDPDDPMPYWGIAIANGPHINNPQMDEKQAREASAAIAEAVKRKSGASEVNRALIDALAKRYRALGGGQAPALQDGQAPALQDGQAPALQDGQAPQAEAEEYARAMRAVWKRFPSDADVGALYAEALLDLHPWDQWSKDGKPQEDTKEILGVLEAVIKLAPQHPLANHLYVHALESSPTPERADAAADRLRTLAPGLGHLLHMPSHIDVRRGRWAAAIEANEKAIAADAKYHRVVAAQGFYNLYSAHNHHMLAFAAMMSGRKTEALRAMRRLVEEMPAQWLAERALVADGFNALPYEVLLRFGEWDAVLLEPEPAEHLPLSRALRLYARGVAYAAKGDLKAARAEQQRFVAQSALVPEEARFGNNSAHDLLALAAAFLEGEILYREQKIEPALASLREAVKREDELRYDEPPGWIQPARHALGAFLVEQKRYAEAEQVYRDDLVKHPENGWSLFGLATALHAQDKDAAEVDERFRKAWEKADARITSSCFCAPSAPR